MGAPVDDRPDEGEPGAAGPPLDSMAGLRVLGEVQRLGLDAANSVIARLTERTNGSARRPAGDDPVEQLGALAEVFVDSVLAAAGTARSSAGPLQAPDIGPGASGVPEVLSARAAVGERAELELWLHNYTDDVAREIRFHCTGLISSDGEHLEASGVTVGPPGPLELHAASSRRVQVCLDVPTDAAPGRYRGVLSAGGLADMWVVLEVEVTPGADQRSG